MLKDKNIHPYSKAFKLLLTVMLLVSVYNPALKAQDFTDLSNYTVFKPLINPAANSTYENFSGILTGRKQWIGVEGAPANIGLQVVKPIDNYTFGGSLSQESIGVHNMQRAMVNYSFRIKLSGQEKLAFGLGVGGMWLHSNYNKVNTPDWTDAQFIGTKSIVRPDFNFGIFLFSDRYFAGISVPRTVESSILNNNGTLIGHSSFDPTLWTYLLSGGISKNLDNNLILSGSSLVKINPNAPVDIDVNLNLEHEKFGVGISYRTKREVLLSGNISLSENIKFGYCYHSYFNITNAYLDGHEIYILYRYSKKKTVKFQSPRF